MFSLLLEIFYSFYSIKAMQMYIKASDVNSEYAPAYYNIGVM